MSSVTVTSGPPRWPLPPQPPTPEDVLKQVELLNQLYGGVDQRKTS